ncbi:tetratricopeptide repeat protein [Roseicitreum antarcticum]|nr:tetratricopeptide repeat protein [Roseicitreum antarcticum]
MFWAALGSGAAGAQERAGPFLAARAASGIGDHAPAALYFGRVLLADPENPVFLEGGVLANAATGDIETALALARRMVDLGISSQIANLVVLAGDFAQGDYAAVLESQAAGREAGVLVDALATGWAHLGQGSMSESLAAFDTLVADDAMASFGLNQKAFALAMVGDLEAAEAIFAGADGPVAMNRRSVLAHVAILSQLDRMEEATALINDMFDVDAEADILAIRAALADGERIPLTTVTTPQDGLAEALFSVAGALSSDPADEFALLHARLTLYLRPDHADAALLAGRLLAQAGQYALADEAYAQIPEDDPFALGAQLGRAQALYNEGDSEGAIDQLRSLSETHPTSVIAHNTLGDFLRREERFDGAIAAYGRAIDLLDPPESRHWVVFYSRATSHDRSGDWPSAESDFRRALELAPEQPGVLNDLGYSMTEQGGNLEEALAMIERAVEAEPDNGFFVDSLAWALFRMGRYDEAVAPMERASQLLPVDPVLTDHLGDVYWAVDRQREARFQWRRALSYGEHPGLDLERLRRKLEVGLDRVLEEEGAEPLRARDANGN